MAQEPPAPPFRLCNPAPDTCYKVESFRHIPLDAHFFFSQRHSTDLRGNQTRNFPNLKVSAASNVDVLAPGLGGGDVSRLVVCADVGATLCERKKRRRSRSHRREYPKLPGRRREKKKEEKPEIGSAVSFKPISPFPARRRRKAACDQGKYAFSFFALSIPRA